MLGEQVLLLEKVSMSHTECFEVTFFTAILIASITLVR